MMHIKSRALLAVSLVFVLAFGAGATLNAYEHPEGPSGFTPKALATTKRHMVVAANPLAAEAGLAILRQGGSAGGGAFILTWDAASKTLLNIDGRETAPAAATPELFLDAAGKPLPRKEAIES